MFEDNQQNKENENKFKVKNQKHIFFLNFIILSIFIIIFFISFIIFKGKNKYFNFALAQTQVKNFKENQNRNIIYMKNDQENNKKTTVDKDKKGLLYIGEMTSPRIFHQSIKLNDGNILIVNGNNSIEPKKIIYDGEYREPIEYTCEYSAEIFNPKNNTFSKLESKPMQEKILHLLELNNGNILLISDKFYQVFDTNKKVFNLKVEKPIYKFFKGTENHLYAEIINDNALIECYGLINGNHINSCWITNTDNLKLKSKHNINLKVPEYLTPTYFGYLKLNKNEFLIYTKSFPRTNAQNIYIAIYNIKKKKVTKILEVKDVGNYTNSKPILLNNNKILFTGGVEYVKGAYTSYKKTYPWFIYDANTNSIEKTIDMLFPDSMTTQNPIRLENGSILIVENNKIRQLYNIENNNLEKYNGFELKNIENPNIVQINNHQLLITGGRNIKDKTKKIINSSAFIYTF